MNIQQEIKKKFGRVSRFAIIAGIPYQQIIDAERFGREWKLEEIKKKIKTCKDRNIEGEITTELRKEIATLWVGCDQKQARKEFDYKTIDSLMNGKRRMFVTGKVTRLIKRLKELQK